MIRYTIDVLSRLSDCGYSQNRIRRERLIGQATLTQLRHGELVSWKTVDTVCALLGCQPGDFLEYVPDSTEALPSGIKGECDSARQLSKIPTKPQTVF